jgi:hypothetical protein
MLFFYQIEDLQSQLERTMNDSTAHNLDAYTYRRQVDELNADLARLRDQVNYSLQGSHYFQIRKRSDFSFRELTGRNGLLDVVKFLIQTSLHAHAEVILSKFNK